MPDSELDQINKRIAELQGQQAGDSDELAQVNARIAELQGTPAQELSNNRDGGSFGERLKNSIKFTPEGKLKHVQSLVGDDNAFLDGRGEVQFRRAPNELYRAFDESGFTAGDIADAGGSLLEAVPGLLTSIGNRTPAGRASTVLRAAGKAAIADTGGNITRQGLNELIAGDEQLSAADRAKHAGMAATAGALGQGVADVVVAPLARGLNPKNRLISGPAQTALESPEALKGARLSQQTGIDFSLGEESGSRLVKTAETIARKHPLTADRVARADEIKVNQAHRALRDIGERLNSLGGQENAGRAINQAYETARDRAIDLRRITAARDFAIIDEVAGAQPVLPVNNFMNTLDELIQSESGLGRSPALRGLRQLRAQITEQADAVTDDIAQVARQGDAIVVSGATLQNSMARFGRSARGSGQVIKDLDTADQRRIARSLNDALERDLDAAASAHGDASEIGVALREARDNYRANSQHITDIAESALGRRLNTRTLPTPEKLAEQVQKMHVSELREVVGFLSETSPEAMEILKRSTLERMLDKAKLSGSASHAPFSMRKFNTQMRDPDVARRLRTIYSRREFVEIKRVSKAMERLTDRALEGSPTTPLRMAIEFFKTAVGGSLNVPGITQAAGSIFTVDRIARTMTDPAARAAMIEISQASQVTRSVGQAASTLGLIWAEDEVARRDAGLEQQRQASREALERELAGEPPDNQFTQAFAPGGPLAPNQ